MGHPVPLIVKIDGETREATEEELLQYSQAHRTLFTKWRTANRIAYAKQAQNAGTSYGAAWAQAFDLYPSDENGKNKPRFVYNL